MIEKFSEKGLVLSHFSVIVLAKMCIFWRYFLCLDKRVFPSPGLPQMRKPQGDILLLSKMEQPQKESPLCEMWRGYLPCPMPGILPIRPWTVQS
jgi:hypothetical protein